MATLPTAPLSPEPVLVPPSRHAAVNEKMSRSPGKIGVMIFGVVFIIGLIYAGSSLVRDLQFAPSTSAMP